jgi:multicomponent Na+:H+ antiporter subunit C
MISFALYGVVAMAIFAVALHGLMVRPSLLHKVMALNVMGSAVFLFFVALAYRDGDAAPDPVPHAMVLTGIVVAVSTTALALAIARHLAAASGRADMPDSDEDG